MRPLQPATKTALDGPVLPLATLVYLDIENDPLIAWTGIGDLAFAAGETGDPSLDGRTFKGVGTVVSVGQASDGVGGSDSLEIVMPGVDPQSPMLRQLVTYRRRWQFRRAIVWMAVLHPETLAIEGKPFRIITGRIDRMPLSDGDGEATIKAVIEGHASYSKDAINTRYSEQRDIAPNDTSQTWVHALANMQPEMGKSSASGVMNIIGSIVGRQFRNDSGERVY